MILSQSLLLGSAMPHWPLPLTLSEKGTADAFTPALVSFCQWFDRIRMLLPQFGYEEVYIGGSSARELLDHALVGAPLSLRDLDIYLIRNREVFEEDINALATAIESCDLAFRGQERLRAKLRANPSLPSPECYSYAAGLGVHMHAENMPILSLGIFKTLSDLDLNGLFNIDSMFLRLSSSQSSASYFLSVQACGGNLEQLLSHGLTRDPHQGYAAWRTGNLRVVNWCEVKRCFPRHALRIVRTFSKAKRFEIDAESLHDFSNIGMGCGDIDNGREFFRGLFKVFAGKNWASELYMLGQLDVLNVISLQLNSFLRSQSTGELGSIVASSTSALERAKAVIRASGAEDCWFLIENLLAVESSVGKVVAQ